MPTQHIPGLDNKDITDQKLGNVEIIEPQKLQERTTSPVKYTIPPDIDVIGVNTPKYDCCVQKVVDEMGKYIGDFKMQFVLGNDASPPDIIPYFPKYVLYFRSGAINGTPEGILANLNMYIKYYQGLGIPVYYYLDDYLITFNDRAPVRLMANCDGIIVSTNALKEALQVEKISVPIYVLRTHMDLATFDMLPPLDGIRDPDKFNIFFSSQGRVGIQLFYKIVQKMNETPERYKDVHFVSLSHQIAQVRSIINNCRGVKKTYLEWMPLDIYYRLAASMDLILAPGSVGDLDYMMPTELQDVWLDCKSAHKYTLAGAARIPCIASPLQDYREAIKHGETGFIAHDEDEWVKYIDLLLHDKDVREKMGAAAREDIVKNWNIYTRVEEFAGILRKGDVKKVEVEAPNVVLNKYPPVMVHVAVHNARPYIKECLDSVMSQTYPNQEVVISDNACNDGTIEFVEENYPTVKINKWTDFREIANPGLRKAMEGSECQFWTGLGADDKLCTNYWETVLPYFQSNPKIGVTRVGCYQFTDKNPEGSWWRPVPWTNPVDILIVNKIFITSPMSRRAWDSIEKSEWGGWDPNCFFGDWDMWIQVVLAGWNWATCKKPLFWYRRHADAWSFNYDTSPMGIPYTYMRNKWMPELLKYGLKASSMASPDQVAAALKASKYAKEQLICETKPLS